MIESAMTMNSKPLSEIIFDIGQYVKKLEIENMTLRQNLTTIENKDKNQLQLDEIPDVMVAQDIADYMHISRYKVYELMKTSPEYGGIPCFGSGRSVRCMKADFVQWLELQKQARKQKYIAADRS